MEKIDFVVLWVDGNDPEWQAQKNSYQSDLENTDTRSIRYRDWDNLEYWFRAVEKFAPWVNKIHFVTWGHLPSWLNTDNPKLNIVRHSDFIPKQYLPTFSANPIELNLHRIDGLCENFVYFNDDMFITRPVSPSDFFKNGKPRDVAIMYPHISRRSNKTHSEAAIMDIINDHFNKNSVIKNNFLKWFNLKYGLKLVFNFCLMPFGSFPGILNTHLATSLKKSTYETLWQKEEKVLDETCMRKFRFALDVTQWLVQDWQIASGDFCPRSIGFGTNCALCDDAKQNQRIFSKIKSGKYGIMCLNDMVLKSDFEDVRDKLRATFEEVLPEKSSFEK